MSKAVQTLLADALCLEPDARAEVTAELLASLDSPVDSDADAARNADVALARAKRRPGCEILMSLRRARS